MEKIYFIIVDNEQAGPYSIEELKNLKIKKDSLIWKEGLENWVEAVSIEELKPIFIATPPPIPKVKEPEVVVKTNEPLQFEDNLKKEKLEKQKIKTEITKKKTAKEIIRVLRYIKYSLLIGLVAFLVAFGIYNGFKFLIYYPDCKSDYRSIYDLEAECKLYNIQSWKNYEKNQLFSDYKKWANRLGFSFELNKDIYTRILDGNGFQEGKMYKDRTTNHFYNQSFYDYDFQVSANCKYRYMDVNGQIVEMPEPVFNFEDYLTLNGKKNKIDPVTEKNNKLKAAKYDEFKNNVKVGKIKEIKEVDEIRMVIKYGRIVKRNLDYALEYAFYWGIGFLGLVFPGVYLISLLFIGIKSSKEWVEKNSQEN